MRTFPRIVVLSAVLAACSVPPTEAVMETPPAAESCAYEQSPALSGAGQLIMPGAVLAGTVSSAPRERVQRRGGPSEAAVIGDSDHTTKVMEFHLHMEPHGTDAHRASLWRLTIGFIGQIASVGKS